MIQALIFDLDGTVLDNEGMWEEAFAKVVVAEGVKIPTQARQANGWIHEPGIGLEANFKRLLNSDVEQAQILARLVKEAYQELAGGEVRIREGLVELIEKIKEREWLTALATTTLWHVVENELGELQLQLAFDVTTTGDEVVLQKPDPEIYLLTAQKLGVEPEECLVVEDAIGGVRAGIEAGMKTVGIVSDYAPKKTLMAAGAGWIVEEMREISNMLDNI
jgi:HAD superfamily hydrolase (TIGR01509 family)